MRLESLTRTCRRNRGAFAMEPQDALIVALDVDTGEEALALAGELADEVGAFKVGMQLFNSEGPDVVRRIQELGGRVFVDLKFHDIPNPVAAAGRVMARLGCAMFTLHAAGGSDMLWAASQAVRDESAAQGVDEPLILAVTVLTSIGQDQLAREMLIPGASVEEVAAAWGRMAQACGIGGVVCSPREITAGRKACGPGTPHSDPWNPSIMDRRLSRRRPAEDNHSCAGYLPRRRLHSRRPPHHPSPKQA